MSRAWDKLIVALDVTSKEKIRSIIQVLTPKVRKFKIGLIAYTKFGPQVIQWVNKKRAKVFLDFKLYDIPNTMAQVATSFIDLDVWAFTVHIKAGEENLRFLKKIILKEAT
ncbi:MAG: orotidine 5'-phosphate decarboxylase, partial [Candidatus Omnitrophota bacterium]